jgi:hypothetical protein
MSEGILIAEEITKTSTRRLANHLAKTNIIFKNFFLEGYQ